MAATPWAAVVVNYNGGALAEQCVRSLLSSDPAPAEVVVVDNDSTDGSPEALERSGLPVHLVRAGANLGYAGGANLGIRATTAPVVAVLNPDAALLAPGAGPLLERLSEPSVGAAGPRILDPDGTTYPSARRVPSVADAVGHGLLHFVWPANPFTRRYRELDADPAVARDVDWLSGAALWLRRDALDAVDGWDEGYFMYVEDVDLCWRLTRAGWRVVYEPGAVVEHIQGAVTRRRPYRMLAAHHRSLLRFAGKRWRGPKRVLLAPAALFLGLRALVAMADHAVRGVLARRRQGDPSPPAGTE